MRWLHDLHAALFFQGWRHVQSGSFSNSGQEAGQSG